MRSWRLPIVFPDYRRDRRHSRSECLPDSQCRPAIPCASSKAVLIFACSIWCFTLGAVSTGKSIYRFFSPTYRDGRNRCDPSFGGGDMLLIENTEGNLWIAE